MINFNTTNAFDSMMGTIGGLQQAKQNTMNLDAQMQQQQVAAQQQEQQQMIASRTQELMPLVKSGDYDATIELSTINPQIAEAVTKAKASMKEGQEAEIASWLAGYQTAPDKEAYIAQENPNIDIDDNFRGMDVEQRESLTKIVGAQVMPKEMFNATFGGQPEEMTAYQQATIDTKKVDQDLRKLEIQQKSLDAQYKRETDALKRSELEQKIEDNKIARESKVKETKDGLDSAYSGVIDTLNLADAIESHEGFSKAVGIQSAFPTFPGSDAAGVEGMIETLSSQNFLNSIQSMKGMGALSDAEGKKLSSAVASLNTNMSESDFKKALNVIKGITRRGKQKIESSYKAKGLDAPSIDNVYSPASAQQPNNSEYQNIGNYRVKVK